MKTVIKTAIVFGVFDGLHEGHKNLLLQAFQRCEELQCEKLIVVLTLPEVVQAIKGRVPKYSYEARATAIATFNKHLKIIPGDSEIGSWNVLYVHKPDIIFLGYDQHSLAAELDKMKIAYEFLKAYRPDKYKSSLL